jgi:hypothetical protein
VVLQVLDAETLKDRLISEVTIPLLELVKANKTWCVLPRTRAGVHTGCVSCRNGGAQVQTESRRQGRRHHSAEVCARTPLPARPQ